MKICVFGADGYIGASVYKRARSLKGSNVTGTSLEHQKLFPELKQLDVDDPEAFSAFYKREDPDVVVWSIMSGYAEEHLIEAGLIHLIDHLKPETKLVYLSTDLVFGDGDGPYSEDDYLSKLPDDHLYSTYNNAKVKAEYLIRNKLSHYVILRVGPIYGKNDVGQWDERTDKLLYHLRSGRETSHRDDLIRSFVHVQDLTGKIMSTIQSDKSGIYHAGPSAPQSYLDFMQDMAKSYGFSPSLVKQDTEPEAPDHALPKNTALNTTKLRTNLKQKRRWSLT